MPARSAPQIMCMYNGIILLNKEGGMTSHTAVSRLRRLYGGVKAGHTGTLDPMATGVLPVLVGRAVKASEYMTEGNKHYIATLRLGLTTDTEDITGNVLTRADACPPPDEVLAMEARFTGELLQTPPMYSALKVGGQKLVDLARRGETVERVARPITVFCLKIRHLADNDYELDVTCSKGTYIRTLCADIGAALGCGGIMTALTRASAAGFDLADTRTLSELEAMTEEERRSVVIPIEALFSACPAVYAPPFYARLLRNGQAVLAKKLSADLPLGTRVRLIDEQGFYALGEVIEVEDKPAVKTVKIFIL